ncbi:endonuclease/exonuclease/phosphatase family protein [Spirillospora sp. CA-294931]|uniref:endonuclease/exonuclease/phosphatase family protein n=1 Tax=Spirillospora sp. CA-294931 TaxID=3240042 RepID=UPI003D8E63D3
MADSDGFGRARRPSPVLALIAGAVFAAPLVLAPPAAAQAPVARRIRDVQGPGHVSPVNGTSVAAIPGVVTAVSGNGFWMQDPQPDRSDATSEGVFVFTRTRPSVTVGDAVRVDGKVSEFRPGGASSAALGRTEIDATATSVTARGTPLPPPAVLGSKGRRAPDAVISDPRPDAETGRFDAAGNGLDFYESLEGMRVRIQDAVAAGPSRYGEVAVLPAGGGTRTARGGIVLRATDPNPERVILDDVLASLPGMNVGDSLPGANDGVLDYGHGDFKLLLTASPRLRAGGLSRETTRPARPGELAVATADLGDLNPDTPRERFATLAGDIVAGLGSPDLITVTGVQDNSGPDDDGTVAADQTVAELIAAISEAGGPAYDWRSVSPRDNADGGERGGNPRVGFLFRTDRGLSFVDRPSRTPDEEIPEETPGVASTSVQAVDDGTGRARLSLSPGRVSPGDPAWSATRKPLAGEVTWQGRRIIVVANHWFRSTSEDEPLFGRRQPPQRPTEWRRDAQARSVAGFVKSIQAVDRDAEVIVAGNLNEREFATPLKTLTRETGLRDLPSELPEPERYTAVAGGNSQALDHILLSPSLQRRKHEFDIVHRGAEFSDRSGDRDPSVVRIDMSAK